VSRSVFATVAVRRAAAAHDEATGMMWWQIARDAGHPLAVAQPHPAAAGWTPPHTPGPRWRRVLVWSAVSVVVVALVVWLVVRSLGPDRQDIPETLSGFDAACTGTIFPAAPSYQGVPPHPTAALSTTPPHLPVTGLSKIWTPFPALDTGQKLSGAFNPDDPHQVQAVACALFTGGPDTTAIKQCSYIDYNRPGPINHTGTPISMYPGQYTITVYEARTHRTVAQVKANGAGTACPPQVPQYTYQLFSQLTTEQYVQVLSPQIGG
jgi:hypothetical protein